MRHAGREHAGDPTGDAGLRDGAAPELATTWALRRRNGHCAVYRRCIQFSQELSRLRLLAMPARRRVSCSRAPAARVAAFASPLLSCTLESCVSLLPAIAPVRLPVACIRGPALRHEVVRRAAVRWTRVPSPTRDHGAARRFACFSASRAGRPTAVIAGLPRPRQRWGKPLSGLSPVPGRPRRKTPAPSGAVAPPRLGTATPISPHRTNPSLPTFVARLCSWPARRFLVGAE